MAKLLRRLPWIAAFTLFDSTASGDEPVEAVPAVPLSVTSTALLQRAESEGIEVDTAYLRTEDVVAADAAPPAIEVPQSASRVIGDENAFFALSRRLLLSAKTGVKRVTHEDDSEAIVLGGGVRDLVVGDDDGVFDVVGIEDGTVPGQAAFAGALRGTGFIAADKGAALCGVWLIASDLVVTAGHCVPKLPESPEVRFDLFQDSTESEGLTFICRKLCAWDDPDLAVLRCGNAGAQAAGHYVPTVTLADEKPIVGASIYVVHNNCNRKQGPQCRPWKRVSPGVYGEAYDTTTIRHDADTYEGSSGAALFDAQHRVVGLHVMGCYDEECNNESDSARASDKGLFNRAIPIDLIREKLTAVGILGSTPRDKLDPAALKTCADIHSWFDDHSR